MGKVNYVAHWNRSKLPFLGQFSLAPRFRFWLFTVVSDFMRQTDWPAFSRLGASYPRCLVFKVFWKPGAKPGA
jgi:hypothetical protein